MTDLHDALIGSPTPLAAPARVLTFGAHPDDAEFGAGATISRWAKHGASVTMCILTDGSKGSWDASIPAAELIETRQHEQALAARVIGATEVIHLDSVDGDLAYSIALRDELASIIRRTRPDVVLTHDPWQRYQMHPDHRATGRAALDAVVVAREPRALPDSTFPAHRPSAVLLWSADVPDHAEPVSDADFDAKVEALLCHASQSETTMGGARDADAARRAFVDKLRSHHERAGGALGVGPAETFKRITP